MCWQGLGHSTEATSDKGGQGQNAGREGPGSGAAFWRWLVFAPSLACSALIHSRADVGGNHDHYQTMTKSDNSSEDHGRIRTHKPVCVMVSVGFQGVPSEKEVLG
jgi:hypothetical protein